jgi:hypothetical protein
MANDVVDLQNTYHPLNHEEFNKKQRLCDFILFLVSNKKFTLLLICEKFTSDYTQRAWSKVS